MANDKIHNGKTVFDKAVFLYAYLFLLLPVTIFFSTWTKAYIAIPVTLFCAAGFVFIFKSKRIYKDVFGNAFKKRLFIMAVTAFLWTLLSGQGGLFFQNADYNMRNAIFSDLIKFDWPVVFHIPENITNSLTPGTGVYENALYYAGKDVTIVYYLGFWLPPALCAKAFCLISQPAGLAAGNAFLFLWTFSGVFTVLYMFSRAFKTFSCKIMFVFIFFSGVDIIFSLFYYIIGLQGMIFPEGRLIPHLDAWTMQQYSSNTSALYWVFNQAVPLWIFCCILLNEDDLKYIFLPFSCLALNSTLPLIGAFPIIMFFIFKKYYDKVKNEGGGEKNSIKNLLKELLRYVNIPNICGIPILIISYLYLMMSPNSESFSFMLGTPDFVKALIIFGSLLFEAGLLIPVLFFAKQKEHRALLIFLCALLFIIPFFNVGSGYDFTMRASLPALFFLCYTACYTLFKTAKTQICSLLTAILILGGCTAAAEILQPVVYVFTGENPRAEGIESLFDVTSQKFNPKNCLGEISDGFYMKYIFRK